MPVLWIIHRDPRVRAAIARLASAQEDTVLGAPGDPLFEAAPIPDVVLLGLVDLDGDFEPELQFVHRCGMRLGSSAWILLPHAQDAQEVRRLFDAVDAEVLPYPPDTRTLGWRLRSAPTRSRKHPLPLSQRPARDALTARFALWFADLDLPVAMRAIDPHLADVPILIRGEAGSGRGLMVRYLHTFGGTAEGALIRVACTEQTSIHDIAATISSHARTERARAGCAIWLENVDQLAPAVQRELQGWIDFAPPEDLLKTYHVRWIGTLGDDTPLEPALDTALSGLLISLPSLRDRPQLIVPFASDTARSWCEARAERPRRFDDSAAQALLEYTWPGNLRELEAVVVQTLSAGSANPLTARDLVYAGGPFARVNAGATRNEATGPPSWPEEPLRDPHPHPDSSATDSSQDPAWLGAPDEAVEASETPGFARAPTEDLAREDLDLGDAIARRDSTARNDAGVFAAKEPGSRPQGPLRQLADAVAHEILNPLASIRTFAQLLPQRFADEEFRTQFADIVESDVMRATDVANRLSAFAALGPVAREPLDATGMLEQLLEDRRAQFREHNILVLTELDHDRPLVFADDAQLRFALEAVLDQALELVPAKGDLFIASRHHDPEGAGSSLRILVRCGTAKTEGEDTTVASPVRHSLRLAMAEWVVNAQGGRYALDSARSGWLVIVLDLPAP